MKRKTFIRNLTGGSIALTGLTGTLSASELTTGNKTSAAAKFKLKYAPNFGMFKEHAGDDLIDQIRFMHDQGFRAIFDNGLMNKEPAIQEKIANELARRDMELGPFIIYGGGSKNSLVNCNPDNSDFIREKMKKGLEVRKRTNVKTALLVPGNYDQKLAWDYQTANVIENMRLCCDIVGDSGLTLVMEPLNNLINHPGLFLTTIPQAFLICKAVNHPSCKIVNDLYHQQISEGNLIPNIDMAWDYIAAFHIGDTPGRMEPTTGEINYLNVFRHIHSKEYEGVLCMEHRKSLPGKEGEQALIEAYRKVDAF